MNFQLQKTTCRTKFIIKRQFLQYLARVWTSNSLTTRSEVSLCAFMSTMTKNFQENWPKCEKENTDYFLRFFQTQRVESHGFSVDYITITRGIVLSLDSTSLGTTSKVQHLINEFMNTLHM